MHQFCIHLGLLYFSGLVPDRGVGPQRTRRYIVNTVNSLEMFNSEMRGRIQSSATHFYI